MCTWDVLDSQAALALETSLRDVAWSGEKGGKSVGNEKDQTP
jgi:hypothetical protein